MPSLNAKALAEMLSLPAYNQSRLLYAQKYPKQEPQKFRTPYYLPALTAIRHFYGEGRDHKVLKAAIADIPQKIGNEARRAHNLRVISKFQESDQSDRELVPLTNSKISFEIDTVLMRLSADMQATQRGKPHAIFYNCRDVIVDPEIARKTLEIGYWLLEVNEVEIAPRCVEFVDFQAKKVHRISRSNASTIRLLKKNIPIIEALWAAA